MLIRRVSAVGLSVFVLSVSSAAAADAPAVGVVAGANISSAQLAGVDATGLDASRQAGAFVGVFAVWPITGVVAIQPEIAYAQRRFSVKDTLSSFSATEKWDSLEVPILARVNVWRASGHAVYVIGGPGFEFLVRAKEEAAGTTSDVKDSVRGVDVSLVIGAGVSMGRFGVEAQYDAGLRDLNRDNALGDDLRVKSRTIRVDVTWAFR